MLPVGSIVLYDQFSVLPFVHFLSAAIAGRSNFGFSSFYYSSCRCGSRSRSNNRFSYRMLAFAFGQLIMIECIEIKVGHQFCFNIINRLIQCFDEFVEVFFVQENFVTVIAVIIKPFATFSDGQVIVIPSGSSYIKKVRSSLSSTDALAVNALHLFVVVLVRHLFSFFS